MNLELIPIGFSTKSRGINGQFKIKIEDKFKPDLLNARALFLNLNGSKVPFLIEEIQDAGQLIVKLEDINSPESVSGLLSKELFIDKEELTPASLDKDSNLPELIGYTIYDQDQKKVGEITDLEEYPNQIMSKVIYDNKEILLPIHEDLIINMNKELKTLILELPEGILEL